MRIGIDISSITAMRTGIGCYTYELTRRLLRCEKHQFVLFFNSLRNPLPDFPELHNANVTVRHFRIPGPLLLKSWQYINRPHIEWFVGPVDVFHSPATYVPPQRTGMSVTTVHDLYFDAKPGDTSWLGGKYLRWVLRNRLSNSEGLIAVSSLTANSLRTSLGTPHPDIAVIAHGIDDRFFAPVEAQQIRAVHNRYAIPDRYILHVGTHEPRKNIETLVKAHQIATGSSGRTVPPLVLAGAHGTNPGSERVFCPGFVADADLPALYAGAELFVYPSHLEGFGLPVLEAMAQRVPVICSHNVGALEFLPADSAIVVDPASPPSIADAISRCLEMPMETRARMVAATREIVNRMTWDLCAQLTLAYFESLCSAGCGSHR